MAIAMSLLILPEGAILSMLLELRKKDLPRYSSIKSKLSSFHNRQLTQGVVARPAHVRMYDHKKQKRKQTLNIS